MCAPNGPLRNTRAMCTMEKPVRALSQAACLQDLMAAIKVTDLKAGEKLFQQPVMRLIPPQNSSWQWSMLTLA